MITRSLILLILAVSLQGCGGPEPLTYENRMKKLLELECKDNLINLPDVPVPPLPKRRYFKKDVRLEDAIRMQEVSLNKLHRIIYISRGNIIAFNKLKKKKFDEIKNKKKK